MLNRIKFDYLLNIFNNRDRSANIKANILGSFILKGISIFLGLVVVPLTINYISPYQYGVWITLSSIIGWLSFFDIGFGNGLKNKFVEAIAQDNIKLAKIYISTTYAVITIIICTLWFISVIVSKFINWNVFLNVDSKENIDLNGVVLIVLTTFAFQFILGLFNTILTSIQKPVIISLINVISQTLILIGIKVLMITTSGSLTNLSILMGGVNSIVLLVFSLYFFNTKLAKYAPNINYVDFSYSKDLLNVGLKFFILQIIAIIYYETNNIIITKILTPLDVTTYNLAFKYMSILGMAFGIILTPFWSAFIEANVLKDYKWMKDVRHKLYIVYIVFLMLAILLVFISSIFYQIWFSDKIFIPFKLTVLMAIWQICNMWNSLHSTLIYGFAKVKIQLISSISIGLVNIPLTVLLCEKYGLNGVAVSQIFLALLICWIGPIQLNKLINENAYGVWNK